LSSSNCPQAHRRSMVELDVSMFARLPGGSR
jgi:hypothetical protein